MNTDMTARKLAVPTPGPDLADELVGQAEPPINPRTLRTAFARFPTGVVALCAVRTENGQAETIGMSASTFVGVSLEPALVSVSIQLGSATWPRLKDLPNIGVSVLSEANEDHVYQLSRKSGDRFAGVDVSTEPNGAVFIRGSAMRLDCTLISEVDAGDHLLALFRVNGVNLSPSVAPIVFHDSKLRQLRQ